MATKNFTSPKRKRREISLLKKFSFSNLSSFLFLFFLSIISERILVTCASQITLTIKASGNKQRLINAAFKEKIEKVTVNNGPSDCTDTCNLNSGTHTVVIVFNNIEINSCEGMFAGLTNITGVNLDSFVSSAVANMDKMFQNCADLETVTFGNMGTHNAYT